MGQQVTRIVPQTVLTTSLTNSQQDATAHDTAVIAAMDDILASPPTGFASGSINLEPTLYTSDGTNYTFTTTITYSTTNAS